MRMISCLILMVVLAFPLSASADFPAKKNYSKPSVQTALMTGVGSVVGTAVYAPIKVATAVSGLVVGLAVSPFSDMMLGTKFARDLIEASVCGDYTLSDEMLRGEEKLCYWYSAGCGPY